MMAPTSARPATSVLVPFSVLAVLSGLALQVFGLPGFVAAWIGVMVAAFNEPAPKLTGKKDASGQPTALGSEQKLLSRWQFANRLRLGLLFNPGTFNPTARILTSFVAGVGGGLIAWSLPLLPGVPAWVGLAQAYAAFNLIAFPMLCKRSSHPLAPCPGVGVVDMVGALRGAAKWMRWLTLAGLAVVLGLSAGVGILAVKLLALSTAGFVTLSVGLCLCGLSALCFLVGRQGALAEWKILVQARAVWQDQWGRIPKLPAVPFLVSREYVGPYVVDVFEAVNGWTSMVDQNMEKQLRAVLPPGTGVHLLAHEGVDVEGNPTPGVPHPNLFRVVTFDPAQLPSLLDSGCDEKVAALVMELAVVPASMAYNSQAPRLTSCVKVASDPNVWVGVFAETMYTFKVSSTMDNATGMDGLTTSMLRTPNVLDAVAGDGSSILIAGDWNSSDISFDAQVCAPFINPALGAKDMEQFILYTTEINAWRGRWTTAKAPHPPHPQMRLAKTFRVNVVGGGVVKVDLLPHIVPGGAPPEDFWKYAPALAATIPGGAKLCVVTPFTTSGNGGGVRHEAAFNLVYSTDQVPSNPAMIAPGDTDGAKTVLSALLSSAFDKARMPRPEVLRARCLTVPSEDGHCWELQLRLYGLLPAQLRQSVGKLVANLGCEWVRVVPGDGDKATLYLGTNPHGRGLVRESDAPLLASLDWGQAWVDTKLTSDDGRTPVLVDTSSVEGNPQISMLDFNLVPGGPDLARIRGNVAKLKAATNNAFIQVSQGEGGPQTLRVLCSRQDPLPILAPFDFVKADELTAQGLLPFGVDVTGQTLCLRPQDVHLAVFGMTGGGKSVLLQSLLYGSCLAGWDVYIGDPTKGGADFQFARPYAKSIAQTLHGAGQMMRHVYEEVKRRKDLNAKYGASSINDLPEDVRPAKMLVMLDEFTSLVIPDPVPAASDDVEADLEREAVIASNAQRAAIGTATARVAREARSAGVVLVLATQKLTAKILDSIPGSNDLKANLSRLLLGKHSYGDKQAAFRQPDDAPDLGDLVPVGRGIFESAASASQIVQAWFEAGGQDELASMLAERIQPLPGARVHDFDAATVVTTTKPAVESGSPSVLGELDLSNLQLGEEEEEGADDPQTDTVSSSDLDLVAENAHEDYDPWEQIDQETDTALHVPLPQEEVEDLPPDDDGDDADGEAVDVEPNIHEVFNDF